MLKPLIKYTGGKYNEYKKIRDFIPQKINNYLEPFFGGGGILFRLHNEGLITGKACINDISQPLMDFYRSVGDGSIGVELSKISEAWKLTGEFADSFHLKYGNLFMELVLSKDTTRTIISDSAIDFISYWVSKYNYNMHGFDLAKKVSESINDKLSKFIKKDISQSETDIPYKCITTAIHQAFYFIIRDMYNDWNNNGNKTEYSQAEMSAHFMFIREFCFGSMHRFGSDGNFNVPYGGFSYNSKCFSCKTDQASSNEVIELFRSADIKCMDFEEAIHNWNPGESDFMFIDPPYDSTFTDYDNSSFGKEEHTRLANCLKNCKCNWLIAIGKTDFIYDLYKDYNIVEYDKTYAYQAKGEYDNKHTTHLAITNYPLNVE